MDDRLDYYTPRPLPVGRTTLRDAVNERIEWHVAVDNNKPPTALQAVEVNQFRAFLSRDSVIGNQPTNDGTKYNYCSSTSAK